ncbi:unnamed protein product, partial [Mesorhabditis spiculigera]
MLNLKELLPQPSAATEEVNAVRTSDPWFRGREDGIPSMAVVTKEPPRYGHRVGFKPRTPEDFGDGGAFPEVHIAQFPLGMGLGRVEGTTKTVALQYDAEGKLRHDAIARVGVGKDKIVHTKLSDMKSKAWDEDDEDLQKPDDEETRAATEATRQALEQLTQTKISSALPVQHAQKVAPAQYIRYTPAQQGGGHASGAGQRIIRMVEMQKDPMEPPKFKINQKIPMAPPSPPAPVMHSPPRKVTQKEAADWKIPPCISNWKNPKGFTVALDKRLAADGRGLQQQHVNENFAKLSEAMYIADRKAREAVDARANLEKRVAQNKKAEQESKMRELAQKARKERSGIQGEASRGHREEDDEEIRKREEIRRDRVDEFRRDRNIARNKPDKADKLRRERERDISEKIAIGLPDARNRGTAGETQFDQRLFDQSKGLDSGALADDTYNPYDKPWRATDNIQQHIYRPGKHLDQDVYGDDLDKIVSQKRFVPDKGFSGTEAAPTRGSGPVQFERAAPTDDILGLDTLFAKTGDKRGGGRDDRDSKRSKRD